MSATTSEARHADRDDEARRARARAEAERRAAASARADREFEDALMTFGAEIAELRRTIHRLVDQLGRVGEAGGHTVRAGLQAASTDGLGASKQATSALGGEMRGLKDDLVRTAREHPWRTVGLAAISGIVLGFAMRR
jgi:ElaB/YqjD/DUF883 family membrane-anchored ribosome-binding protein